MVSNNKTLLEGSKTKRSEGLEAEGFNKLENNRLLIVDKRLSYISLFDRSRATGVSSELGL